MSGKWLVTVISCPTPGFFDVFVNGQHDASLPGAEAIERAKAKAWDTYRELQRQARDGLTDFGPNGINVTEFDVNWSIEPWRAGQRRYWVALDV